MNISVQRRLQQEMRLQNNMQLRLQPNDPGIPPFAMTQEEFEQVVARRATAALSWPAFADSSNPQ